MVRARNSYEPGTRPSSRAVQGTILKSNRVRKPKPSALSGTKETWTAPFAPLIWSGLLAGLIATGIDMKIEIAPGLSPEEQSITIYYPGKKGSHPCTY